jgi:hypothetical protein
MMQDIFFIIQWSYYKQTDPEEPVCIIIRYRPLIVDCQCRLYGIEMSLAIGEQNGCHIGGTGLVGGQDSLEISREYSRTIVIIVIVDSLVEPIGI